ncbi:MAG: sn-glycerol-3-phosphate ABC transporter ATP-binding protein UgpC, partial [Clostridia bacterium]|nr:sn-glycerol-3-phosphate ABC transporter ATP-binding protein UgpC [Clostridia bacterium]
MASLKLKNVYKIFGNESTPAVTDFSLDIEDKEFLVIVGPSGCGKTTTLRMIAGLDPISEGELYIDGKLVNDVQPKDRDIAMVFQNYALYQHMSVYENMAFGLKLRKMPKANIDERVREAARILGLEPYLSRKPKALSGGQRQRVALGRAIVREPKVFLLDEPLSNLDANLRAQMRTEIAKLHHRLSITFIYVTHDQVEAMTMGTRIVVMRDGLIQQVDTPQNLYDYPANLFVAGFIGAPQMNFFDAVLTGTKDEVKVEFEGASVKLPPEKAAKIIGLEKYLNTGKKLVFGVRPEDLHDEEPFVSASTESVLSVRVDVVEKLGSETIINCSFDSEGGEKDEALGSASIVAKVGSDSNAYRNQRLKLAVDAMHVHLFDKETELAVLEGEGEKAYVPGIENIRRTVRAALEGYFAAEEKMKAAEKE